MLAELISIDLEKELGLETLPSEQREKILSTMGDIVAGRLNTRLLTMLTEAQKQELDVVLDADGDVTAFFKERIPNIDLIVAEIVAEFKSEALALYQSTNQL